MSAVEKFPLLLSEAEEESSAVAPCFSHEGINVRSPSRFSRAGRLACPLPASSPTALWILDMPYWDLEQLLIL